MLGRGHISHYNEYALSATLSIYSTSIATCIVLMLFSYAIVDFYVFYDWAVDMQILIPLTRNQCRVGLFYNNMRVLLQIHDEFTRNGTMQRVKSNQHQNLCYRDMIQKQ